MTDEELVFEYQNGTESAFVELLERYENVLKYYTRKYKFLCQKSCLTDDDLMQEGRIALNRAALKYKNRADICFAQYAHVAIKRGVYRGLQKTFAKTNKKAAYSEHITIGSIDSSLTTDDDFTLLSVLSSEDTNLQINEIDDFLHQEYLQQLHEDLIDLINTVFYKQDELVQRRKEVLIFRYGLNGKIKTMEELANEYGVAISSINYYERSAISQIRKSDYGKYFMNQYSDEAIDHLKSKKESINVYQAPQMILSKLESLDEMISSFEKYAM